MIREEINSKFKNQKTSQNQKMIDRTGKPLAKLAKIKRNNTEITQK